LRLVGRDERVGEALGDAAAQLLGDGGLLVEARRDAGAFAIAVAEQPGMGVRRLDQQLGELGEEVVERALGALGAQSGEELHHVGSPPRAAWRLTLLVPGRSGADRMLRRRTGMRLSARRPLEAANVGARGNR